MPQPQLPSRPPFDSRPQMEPPIRPARRTLLLSWTLVLTGAVAIIVGVAIIFWPAALIVGGATALLIGTLATNVVSDPAAAEEPPDG